MKSHYNWQEEIKKYVDVALVNESVKGQELL